MKCSKIPVIPLSELKKNESGRVAHIQTSDAGILNKIMAMGILPGLYIKLIQRFPSFVFQIGESRFAVDKELAERIAVRRI